jgi:hypothetical protein
MAVSAAKPICSPRRLAQLAPQREALAKSITGHQLPWHIGKSVQASTA